MAYDTKCHDIAVWFLADHPEVVSPEAVQRIAQSVQNTIEDEIWWLTVGAKESENRND